MSLVIPPMVHNMIVCDEVLYEQERPGKLTAVGIITLLHWEPASPRLELEKLTVLLILAGGRGVGQGRVLCVDEVNGRPVFGSRNSLISFVGKDPSLPQGVTFVLHKCRISEPGGYLMQFLFNEQVLAQRVVIVRSTHE